MQANVAQAPVASMQAAGQTSAKETTDAEGMAAHEISLRDQLLAVAGQPQSRPQSVHTLPPIAPAQPHSETPHGTSQSEDIDPSMSSPYMVSQAQENGGGGVVGAHATSDAAGRRGGKRELSGTKRAAQNRAAQRAFRQRKEGYIKRLEDQVRSGVYPTQAEDVQRLQSENQRLREYIAVLQTRLLETEGSYPSPQMQPDHRYSRSMDHEPAASTPEGMASNTVSQLQAAAAAAQAEHYEDQSRHQNEPSKYERSEYPPMPSRQTDVPAEEER